MKTSFQNTKEKCLVYMKSYVDVMRNPVQVYAKSAKLVTEEDLQAVRQMVSLYYVLYQLGMLHSNAAVAEN